MNPFDKHILLCLNEYVGRWPHFEVLLAEFQKNNFLKGALFMLPIWYLWHCSAPTEQATLQTRQKLFATVVAMVTGIIVARLLADLLPFRARPIFNTELNLRPSAVVDANGLATWSAFPSDHAVVWFTVAFGVLQIHRPLGWLLCLYGRFLAFGRIFFGFHHPTDILGAVIISMGTLWLCLRAPIRETLYAPMARLQQRHPAAVWAAAFLASYEVANLFDDVRQIAEHARSMLRTVI